MTEAEKLLAANDEETLIEKILTKYLAYCKADLCVAASIVALPVDYSVSGMAWR